MIGEIRDNETARIAVRASITGHLVLSTLHTNNSLTTIERLVDMDVERYLLGSALEAIVSQRLCKKLCPKCRSARPTTPYEKRVFKEALGMDIENIYKPVGCDSCYKGYSGRIALHEVLLLNQEIRDGIVNNLSNEKIRDLIYKSGNTVSLLDDGLIKVINGLTSFEEVLRVIDLEEDLGEEQKELKNAIIGKADNHEKKEEVLDSSFIETLEI
jgi:type IV pilus assembly protein PilB